MLGWFRKHAKILMVVLGSSAMAIFGLGPVFDTLASRGGGDSDRAKEVIASWNGGEITRTDLDIMGQRHYQSQRFLSAVREAAEKKKGDVVNSLALPISRIRDGSQEIVDDQLITRYLMAQRAKQEGMLVSDGMVNDYIAMLSGDAGFSNRDLEAINDAVNNRRCSLQAVREQLKTELLSNQMQLCAMTAVPIVPNPVESMELYRRTMEQVECEVLPIEVDKYVSQVTESPSAAELKQLYEEGKYQFPDPTGEKPGFKIGRKVNVQYLVADYETYLQNEMNKLSDEDVQKEYERLVEEKSELVLEPVEIEDNSININEPPPSDAEKDPAPAPGATDTEAPGDVSPPPSSEEGESEEGKSEEGKSEEGKPEEGKPEEGKDESSPPADDGKQSLNVRSSKFQFVSTGVQEEKQEDATDTAGETKKPDPPAAEEAATSNQDAAKESSQPAATDETSNEESSAKPEDGDVGGVGEILKDVEADAQDKKEEPERKIKPLKDVVEDVKRSMSEPAASKTMNQALTKASVMVQDHFEKLLRWDASRKKGEEPEPIDIQELAKKYNLIANESGLVDDYELSQSQIGQVRVFMNLMVQGRPTPRLVPVAQLVFDDFSALNLFDSKIVDDNWATKSSFLYWVSEKAGTRIPTLDECRPEIEKFWRSRKALELALAEAESIKSKVNATRNKKLSELYFERVFPTGAFTWFSNFGSTRYASPMGVTGAEDEFMRTAFSLAELEAGIARNGPKDTVYVIQAISESKGAEEIGTDYLENQYFKYKKIPNEVLRVSQLYFQELNLDWNEEFQETMGLKFLDR